MQALIDLTPLCIMWLCPFLFNTHIKTRQKKRNIGFSDNRQQKSRVLLGCMVDDGWGQEKEEKEALK